MYDPAGVTISANFPVPGQMKAWVLGDPDQLFLRDKPTPVPGRAEVLVRIDAVAICATDLEIIHGGSPASIQGGPPFNRNFTPGHEYMGTVAALGPGVDDSPSASASAWKSMPAAASASDAARACTPPVSTTESPTKAIAPTALPPTAGLPNTRSTTSTRWCRYPTRMSDAEATLVVTAGTSMYGLTELGGLVAGESLVVIGPGPIGLLAVAVAKALGANPVILTGTRNKRLAIGKELGADRVVNIATKMRSRRSSAHRRHRRGLCGRMRRAPRPPSTRPFTWPIAAARSALRPFRTIR